MSDYSPIEPSRSRGPRLGVLIGLIALAFLIGAVAMGYAMRHVGWFGANTTTATTSTATRTTGAGFTPPSRWGPAKRCR